jgi:cystathionine beta-lyase
MPTTPRRTRTPASQLVTGGRQGENFGFINPPLVRGSTVLHHSTAEYLERRKLFAAGADRPVSYGIRGTPTHHALYDTLTELEGGHATWALPSGLAACTVPILAFVKAGDHVLIPDSVYGPTRQFCFEVLPRYGVEASVYAPRIGQKAGQDADGAAAIDAIFRPNTRVLFLESPGSLTLEMQDVPALARAARARGVTTIIDNTWATPLFFRPLAHGVDVVVHAATKYIGGHSDLILGTVTCNEASWPALRAMFNLLGMTTSPDDCWLALRGLRSLAARLPLHRTNAERLIAWLQAQPEVARVLWPALPDDPGHAIWQRDFSGAAGVFSVVLKPEVTPAQFAAMNDALQLFGRGVSWGGYESLLIPVGAERALPSPLAEGIVFRINAGLEAADDLVADLEQGFARLRAGG